MESALNVNKKRFRVIASIGSAGLIALLVMLLMTGTIFAAFPLAGIGGFTVEASKIVGNQFELYPEVGPTEGSDKWMNAAIYIEGETKITQLNLAKTLDVSSTLGSYGVNTVDIIISNSGSDITAEGLRLRVTGLQSDDSLLTNLGIQEGVNNKDGDRQPFILSSDVVNLTNAQLNTHYLSVGSIGIPGLKIQLVHNTTDGKKGGF